MKVNLFDIDVDNLTMEETLQRIEDFINSKVPHQHIVVNVNKIITANKDKAFRKIINNCDLINADGMPLVWASKILGKPLKERVAGVDIFLELIKIATRKNWKLYFLGAKMAVLKKALNNLREKYPTLKIVGYADGHWERTEELEIIANIINAQPDILFVGISSPKKEYFLTKYLERIKVPFAMGVGGAFDVLAGKIRRAPLWMQRIGLEWFYRFLKEPRRLFKRYFIEGPCFLSLFFRELLFNKYKNKND